MTDETTADLRACGCRYDTEHTYGCPVRGGMITSLTGMSVHKAPYMRDGLVITSAAHPSGSALLIGTCPLTPIEQAGKEARLTVRRGLADVLAWLGHAVENEPTGDEIYAALMNGTRP